MPSERASRKARLKHVLRQAGIQGGLFAAYTRGARRFQPILAHAAALVLFATATRAGVVSSNRGDCHVSFILRSQRCYHNGSRGSIGTPGSPARSEGVPARAVRPPAHALSDDDDVPAPALVVARQRDAGCIRVAKRRCGPRLSLRSSAASATARARLQHIDGLQRPRKRAFLRCGRPASQEPQGLPQGLEAICGAMNAAGGRHAALNVVYDLLAPGAPVAKEASNGLGSVLRSMLACHAVRAGIAGRRLTGDLAQTPGCPAARCRRGGWRHAARRPSRPRRRARERSSPPAVRILTPP